jgi:putative ABC transport system substrate-binding protein
MRRREFIAGLGTAAALPITAHAEQLNVPVIGFVNYFDETGPFIKAFRAGLADGGFIEGKNLSIEYRHANGDFRLLPSLVADLVGRQPTVLVATPAGNPARAAKAATSTIPIVFFYGGDPVKDGLIASLNRPGGNLTGITTFATELAGKRLDLLLKMVPRARKVGYLSGDRSFPGYERQKTLMLAAGRALHAEIVTIECRDDRDFEAAVTKMVEGGAEAMILGNFSFSNRDKVVSLAALHQLPAIYPWRELTRVGGLMSYGTDIEAVYRRLGSAYVVQILKGEKPAEIPVERPTKFELVISLKTAKALGLVVPRTLLAFADELID